MPSWQWSYQYGEADTATVLFNASPASGICRWRAPLRDNPEPRQVQVRHVDGSVVTYTVGAAGRLIVLRFENMPAGSAAVATQLWGHAGITEFLATHARHGENTFGYYDDLGSAEVEVRYLGGFESWQMSRGLWSGTISLSAEV